MSWNFWIDRGGTFTDIITKSPDGDLKTLKLLSDNPAQYKDAAIEGIKILLKKEGNLDFSKNNVDLVKMGTTVATNALLERKGEKTALLITKGLKDIIKIGYQNRPRLFDLNIQLPEVLYSEAIEVDERVLVDGTVRKSLDTKQTEIDLKRLYQQGYRSLAVVLMHAYRYQDHEKQIFTIAQKIGFTQISLSHQISSLIKIVSRGDTTVADAYLNPILKKYVDQVSTHLDKDKLYFMQSNSGLTSAKNFQGKDAILSGPAGGIIGMVKTASMAGFNQVIGFDMGGTSTDVSHFNGEYERVFETVVSGVRLRAPMMNIHTVAAGGGSILNFDSMRFTVGPKSAGAYPGPACYRNDGPLTVTDCNVLLGKIQAEFFPKVFGHSADQMIDVEIVRSKFQMLAEKSEKSAEEVAEGFLKIAVENMVNAIRKISIQRGYDLNQYTLSCFGGAGAQHACLVAESLDIKSVFMHPLSGVLSAYGMGLADIIEMASLSIEKTLQEKLIDELDHHFQQLANQCIFKLEQQAIHQKDITVDKKVHLRYAGTNTDLLVDFADLITMQKHFTKAHNQRFGFAIQDRQLVVSALSLEAKGATEKINEKKYQIKDSVTIKSLCQKKIFFKGKYRDTDFYAQEDLISGATIDGPAIIIEPLSTIIVEPGWQLFVNEFRHIILQRKEEERQNEAISLKKADPIRLEIFNNLFMSIAEQMGETLANTAYSVNIKERLDFSCAVFDRDANLIANAPHMPVHLGSMGASVQSVIEKWFDDMKEGDSYVLNDPYGGGTHLPDITLITPVFHENKIQFYIASRGHHADVGGITPGSMPSNSTHLDEEGVLIPNQRLVENWTLNEEQIKACFINAKFPVRNIAQNLEDLKAQQAANKKGITEIEKMVRQYGINTVLKYVEFIQDNAEESVRRSIEKLSSNRFELKMDDGSMIRVSITIDRKNRSAEIDFNGTSGQHPQNYNAPLAVCKAAVLYVFRTIIDQDIPMNEGCLKPITLKVPKGCMLNPLYPAAVVAGNVETSQAIVDSLLGALNIVAESQGTMNNLTFGNEQYQYYETICGGSGAGDGFNGSDAVHTHMTNSLMTDAEILELRYPVVLKQFQIRTGSGGQGLFKGGDGVKREIEFLEEMHGAILSSHRVYPPYGIKGGKSALIGTNTIIRKDGKKEHLNFSSQFNVAPGDSVQIETPGGGGFGEE